MLTSRARTKWLYRSDRIIVLYVPDSNWGNFMGRAIYTPIKGPLLIRLVLRARGPQTRLGRPRAMAH